MDQIGVCYGGPSPEHDISILTGLQICRVLHEAGNDVVGVYWTKTGDWYQVPALLEAKNFAQGPPAAAARLHLRAELGGGFADDSRKHRDVPFDVIVNCCHGGPGENGTLQAAFDLAGIRYTGRPQPAPRWEWTSSPRRPWHARQVSQSTTNSRRSPPIRCTRPSPVRSS